ncbi:MAG: hypothetical protein ABIN61_02445 [candidate division WOR-3 bacterium]
MIEEKTHRKIKILIAFTCPNCGAELDVQEGVTNTKCSFCKTRFLLTKKIGFPRFFAKPIIKNPEKIIRDSFKENIEIIDLDLIFLPLIRVNGEVIGWIKGFKKRKVAQQHYNPLETKFNNLENISTSKILGEESVEKRIRRFLEVNLDPLGFYRYGIQRINLEGKKFQIYEDRIIRQYGSVFDLPLSIEEYIEKATKIFIETIIRDYKDFDELEYYLKIIKKKALTYYNPIFFSRIKVGEEFYTFSLDATNGAPLLKEQERKMKIVSDKVYIGINKLYAFIAIGGLTISFLSYFFGKGLGIIAGLFLIFFIWRLQYGRK